MVGVEATGRKGEGGGQRGRGGGEGCALGGWWLQSGVTDGVGSIPAIPQSITPASIERSKKANVHVVRFGLEAFRAEDSHGWAKSAAAAAGKRRALACWKGVEVGVGSKGGGGQRKGGAQEGVTAGVVPGRVDPAVRALHPDPAQRQALPHPLRPARPRAGRVTAGGCRGSSGYDERPARLLRELSRLRCPLALSRQREDAPIKA